MGSEQQEALFRGYEGRILVTITGGSFFISMVAMVIPPLLPAIIESLDISPGEAGFVMTVWWLAIALLNAPGGRLADTLSHKTGLIAGLFVAIGGLVILINAPTYGLLLLGVAVVGVGRGIYQPSAIGQIADLYVARRAQALGLRGAAFNLGGVISGGLAAIVLALATWREAFFPILGGVLVILVCMHVFNREPYVIDRVHLNLRDTLTRLRASRNIILAIIALSLFGFVWNGAVSFLPSFLQFGKEFSPIQASIAFSGVFVIGMLTQPVYGAFGDRYGQAFAATIAATLCATGLLGLLLADTILLIALALGVFAVGLASFWPVMMAYGLAHLSPASRAGDWGAITAIFLTTEALGSLYVGLAIDYTSYTTAFASLLLCLLATIMITFHLSTKRAT